MTVKTDLQSLIDPYLETYSSQSQKTLEAKRFVIESFVASLPENNFELCESVYDNWISSQHSTGSTNSNKLSILKQFLRFSSAFGIHSEEPVIPKKHDDYIPYLFSEKEIRQLIEAADNTYSMSHKAKTKDFTYPMILRLLICTGMRAREVLNLKICDFDEGNFCLVLHHTKNDKERIIPLTEELGDLLQTYIERLREEIPDGIYLFPQNDLNKPISLHELDYEFNKSLALIGIRKRAINKNGRGVCVHCLRHYFTVHSLKQLHNKNIPNEMILLSGYLGHENFRDTERYLKFKIDDYPESIDRFEDYTADVFEENS